MSISPISIGPKKKIAFVCSGGATKAGAFHLGVALALQEYGFKFVGGLTSPGNASERKPMEIATYVGSSAGSLISTYLAAGYSLETIFNSFLAKDDNETVDPTQPRLPRLTYNKMFRFRKDLAKEQIAQLLDLKKVASAILRGDWEYLVEQRWLRMTGLFSTAGIEQFVREEVLLSNNFADYTPDLYIVGTQLNHSKKIVFGKYNYESLRAETNVQYVNDTPISDAVAASTSLPFIYAPYPIQHGGNRGEAEYIDGEIRDTLSTQVAADSGADLIIASYTHQPYHYTKAVGSLSQLGLPAILIQSIYLVVEQKINNYIRTKTEKHNAIDAVAKYCKQHGLGSEHTDRIVQILEAELHHRREIDTIYIHPKATDHEMFTREHFSLNPKKLADIVRSGFRAAVDTLKQYQLADAPARNPRARKSATRSS